MDNLSLSKKMYPTYIQNIQVTYNDMLNTLPEAGSWGSYCVYTGPRGAAQGELPASGTVLSISLYYNL